jgi:UDP-N-acetylmuramate dehydrogenase
MSWAALVERGLARPDVELAPLSTYKLGGRADLVVEAGSIADLEAVAAALAEDPRPVLVVGRGSNLLIADAGYRGVVVRLGAGLAGFEAEEGGVVRAGGALPLPRLARRASELGRGGLEWCVGVPGSVGGAVRQNAGCFGSEVVDALIDAEVIDLRHGGLKTRPASSLDLSYRHSNLMAEEVVVQARFATVPVDPAEAAEEMKRITRWRRDHQPGGTLNAGSVFKNPPGRAAGAIIDDLGLKGFTLGKVRVSPRHANFIEAEPGASAADVRRLIQAVRDRVAVETGIELEPEIQFVGFSPEAG